MSERTFPDYRTRRVTFEGLERIGDWTVKLYAIDAHRSVRPAEVLPSARERIPELLPDVVDGGRATTVAADGAPEGASGADVHGEAFALVHAGEDAVWLLVFWWTDRCLLHRRMVGAALGSPDDFTLPVPDTLVACSWELAVVQHERNAWVRTVQGQGSGASYDGYRGDVLNSVDV